MNCDYQQDDAGTYRCQACGDTKKVSVLRNCRAPMKRKDTTIDTAAILPEPTRKLLGSRLKEMFSVIGIPPCGGCETRAAWLDRVDAWVRKNVAGAAGD